MALCIACGNKFRQPVKQHGRKIKRRPNVLCPSCKRKKKSKTSYKVQEAKLQAVNFRGGCCALCGYDRDIHSLTFHHVYPDDKAFTIADHYWLPFEELTRELRKCICLCQNCHTEVHSGLHDPKKIEEIWQSLNCKKKHHVLTGDSLSGEQPVIDRKDEILNLSSDQIAVSE